MEHDVIIVGAGPTGLVMSAELTRRGLDVVTLERRTGASEQTRAIGVHAPTLAALEASGATERILADAARITRGVARADDRTLARVDFGAVGSRFPFVAAVPQTVTEAAVGAGAEPPRWGTEVSSLTVSPGHVRVTTTTGGRLRARAVVVATGAGARELVRAFTSGRRRVYPDRYLMTDLPRAPGQPADTAIITLDAGGVVESFPLPGGGRRVVAWDPVRAGDEDPQACAIRLRRAVLSRTGDVDLSGRVEQATSFGIRRTLVDRMRVGRIFFIGDAAHEVSPIGGQGMNLGLLDAATLAPALSAWLRDERAEAAIERWADERLSSARTAARIAHLNTLAGRPRRALAQLALISVLPLAITGAARRVAARAFAMGFDASAHPPRGMTHSSG